MEIAKLVHQYIQTFLSWPVATATLVFYFLVTFREPVKAFLNRVVKGQAFGVSIEASTPAEQRKELTESSLHQPEAFKQYSQELSATEKGSLSNRAQIVLNYVQENPEEAATEFGRIYNSYWFERAYNLIFGSQIELLEHLSRLGSTGDKYVNLYGFYQDFLTRLGTESNRQYANYIEFLRDLQFIEIAGEGADITVIITPYGIDFLSYLKTHYSNSYEYKGL